MRVEKKYLIEEVAGHLKKSEYVILANFDKMTVADVAELRQRLAVHKAEFHVVKNSSLRVAAQAMNLPNFDTALTGPTAVVVGGRNSPGVAKVIRDFIKEKQKIVVKAGRVEFKMDKAANVGVGIGKRSFTVAQILENAAVVLEAVGKAKPASFKGRYILNLALASTQSPGIRIAGNEYSKY